MANELLATANIISKRPPEPPNIKDIEQKAITAIGARQTQAELLRRSGKSLKECLTYFGNDYSPLADLYEAKTGVNLISDPYEAQEHPYPITKTCSIVIPAYNSGTQLENTLIAIQSSSFNAKYPQQLEVVIVDDGSPKVNIAELVQKMGLTDLNIKVLRESNGRENKARYSGVLAATGDVVIFTAQDVVYSPQMIEEFMKRHEILDGITCFGFRDNISPNDRRLTRNQIEKGSIGKLGYDYSGDGRINKEGMIDCDWLKTSGHNTPLPIDADNDFFYGWTLQSVAWGFSISASREALLKTKASHDPRYKGFGADDEHLIADLIADGNFVIPLASGIAHHLEHTSRYDKDESKLNWDVWQENLNKSPVRQDLNVPEKTDAVLIYESKNPRVKPEKPVGTPQKDLYQQALTLTRMGLYRKARSVFREAEADYFYDQWFLHDKAVVLTKLGGETNLQEAVAILEDIRQRIPNNTWVETSLAIAYGRNGQYDKSLEAYNRALEIDSDNGIAAIIRTETTPQEKAKELYQTGKKLLERQKPREALRYLEASLALVGGAEKLPDAYQVRQQALNSL